MKKSDVEEISSSFIRSLMKMSDENYLNFQQRAKLQNIMVETIINTHNQGVESAARIVFSDTLNPDVVKKVLALRINND